MSTQYRIHSKSFGLHLEKLANGLILPLVNAFNFAAKVRGQYAYYTNCSIKEDWPKKKCIYLEVYNDSYDIDINRLKSIFNNAYYDFFLPLNTIRENKINITFSDYYFDEYNQYCRDIIIGDEFFYNYHNDAIRWHLGK